MTKWVSVCSAVALLVAAAGCEKKSPTAPSVPDTAAVGPDSVLDAKTGVTLVRPQLVSPAAGATVANVDQPATLVIKNGLSTGGTATYTFEVASDSAFNSKVYTKDGVAQGGNGQTSLTIDKLKPGTDYFWRARINAGSTGGPYSVARPLTIGPEVVLQAPVPSDPGANSTVGSTPTLTVNNAQRQGPAGTIFYRFEVSESSSFDNLVFTQTVEERPGATSVAVTTSLQAKTYWWRAQASDPSNKVTSPYSAANPFRVQLFDMREATIVDSPHDLGFWAETSKITSIVITPDAFQVDFDKRTGPGRWPDVGFGSGSLEYTLGMCLNISDHWYCSAVVQFWYGRELTASTPPSYVGRNWFYDGRWGAMLGHQPADGENVGLFACAGNCRDELNGDRSSVHERTNVQFISWINNGAASYSYSLGRVLLPTKH